MQDAVNAKIVLGKGTSWRNTANGIEREKYITEKHGEGYLAREKNQTELRRVKKEISDLKRKLDGLQERKKELDSSLGNCLIADDRLQSVNLRLHPFSTHEPGSASIAVRRAA